MNTMNEKIYYECQLKVPLFEQGGHDTLQQSSCAIIGMGGLGCPVAQYLVPSGIGRIGLYDNDVVDESNINRQILYSYSDIGQKKVQVATDKLQAINPFIQIDAYDMRINEANWEQELSQYDVIIDCTDNFLSKFLIHDACMLLHKKLVQAGVFQTSGQVLHFNFMDNDKERCGCYRCLWEGSPRLDKQASCTMAGVLSLMVGNVGLMQANIAMLSLLGMADTHESCLHIFDWECVEWTKIHIQPRATCICNSEEMRDDITAYLSNVPLERNGFPQDESFVVLDVRNESDQHANEEFAGMHVVSVRDNERNNLKQFASTLDDSVHYVTVCYKGIRSLDVTKHLRSYGVAQVQSLIGGYTNLAK